MMNPGLGVPDMNMLSAAPMQSMFAQAPQIPTEIAPRQGMFGGNGQMAMMAAISALMARRHPQVSQMMQGMMQQRMSQQQAAQEHQQNMQDQRGNFMFEQDYRAQHPEAPAPSEFSKLLTERGIPQGSDEWNKAYDSYINYRQSPDQLVNVPGVGLVQVPRNGGAPQGAPSAPVGKLTPLGAGGPSPQGSGGFPH